MIAGRTWGKARVSIAAAALATSACVPQPPLAPIAPEPVFSPLRFFAGRAEGVATLKVIFAGPRAVRVQSSGAITSDGALVLDQVVEEAGKPARKRQWRIRETRPGHYAGTLSDATSPIVGETTGNRLHLHFTMKGGLDTDQWLTLSPDGQVARNILAVRKFGLRVAVLDETIRRASDVGGGGGNAAMAR